MTRSHLAATIACILALAATAARAQTPTHQWSQNFGSTGADVGYSVATDASGNLLLAGYFTGTVDFGGGPLVSAGASDIVLAKFSPSGAHLWSKRFGGTSDDDGNFVATDISGNVFLTVAFKGTVDFGGGPLASAGGNDIGIAKFNSSGTHLWSRRFGSTLDDDGRSVATNQSGDVYVTGPFQGTVDFGGGPLVSAGFADIFVAKYNSSGTHQWSKRIGSTANDFGFTIAVSGSGDVLVTGYFTGSVDFGGGVLASAGGADSWIAQYDKNGAHLWSRRFGSTANDFGLAVATDASGSVLATTAFQGTVDFGGGALVSAGSADIAVAKYNAAGTHQWSKRFGNTSFDYPNSVATDASGNVFFTGYFNGSENFGGGVLVSAGSTDIIVAKYDGTGAHRWSQSFGSTGADVGCAVATDAFGNAFLTGYFNGTVNFGGGPLVSSTGPADIVIAKFGSYYAEPTITSIADIGNDQGRKVKIRFERSGYDQSGSSSPILQYEAYRRDDTPPASPVAWGDPQALSTRQLLADGWTQVGTVAAHEEDTYGIDVPTVGDSTLALGQYHSVFYIRAATAAPGTFFDSAADSGYSLDNLAPGVPSGFAYNAGMLSWNESPAEDFDYFTVYGANVDNFGSATVVDHSVAPSMNVTAAGYVHYYVTATDFSGNEGKPARINTAAGVGGAPQSYVLSVSNFPNPFNPNTTLRYTVPARAPVTVAIYDARGGRVATLVDSETREAGAYRVDWNGRADSGLAVPSGIYFARIEHAGSIKTRKMVLLK